LHFCKTELFLPTEDELQLTVESSVETKPKHQHQSSKRAISPRA
jgi:hypothetical protein